MSGRRRCTAYVIAASVVQACALTVDTSGLSGGAPGSGATDGGRDGASDLTEGGSSAAPSCAIALAQANVVTADQTATELSVSASTVAVAAGATIFIGIKWQADTLATVTSVSGGGLTWAVDAQAGQNPGIALARAHAPTGLAAGDTLTATFSVAVRKRVLVGAAFFGIAADPLDRVASVTSGSGTSYTSGSVDVPGAGPVIVTAVEMFTSKGTWLPASPTLSASETNAPSSSDDVALHYRMPSNAGPHATSGAWQGTVGGQWLAVAASYKPAVPCR